LEWPPVQLSVYVVLALMNPPVSQRRGIGFTADLEQVK
jgi:hypothetical protein